MTRNRYNLEVSIDRVRGYACGLLIALAPLLTMPVYGEGGTVLILSSDTTVEKYLTAQTSFKKATTASTYEIDLGKKWADDSRVARSIITKDPDVIYCIGSKAYLLAHKVAKDKNIVLSSAINWQRFPLGKNTFGVANELPSEMQLTMFRYFFPKINTIGVLYSKKYNKEWMDLAVHDGKEVDIEVTGRSIKHPKDVEDDLLLLLSEVDAIWLTSDPVVLANKNTIETIFQLADKHNKPVFAYDPAFAGYGATMMLSADIPTIGRQAAGLAEEIIGVRPAGGRFQSPAGSEIIVNLKKIDEYGIELNRDALDSVNSIID